MVSALALWKFLCLRGTFEPPLKTCPLLLLTVSQNASCCDCVAARGSRAWTAARGFRSEVAIGNRCPKSWHKSKHLRNLGWRLVEHGSA